MNTNKTKPEFKYINVDDKKLLKIVEKMKHAVKELAKT